MFTPFLVFPTFSLVIFSLSVSPSHISRLCRAMVNIGLPVFGVKDESNFDTGNIDALHLKAVHPCHVVVGLLDEI